MRAVATLYTHRRGYVHVCVFVWPRVSGNPPTSLTFGAISSSSSQAPSGEVKKKKKTTEPAASASSGGGGGAGRTSAAHAAAVAARADRFRVDAGGAKGGHLAGGAGSSAVVAEANQKVGWWLRRGSRACAVSSFFLHLAPKKTEEKLAFGTCNMPPNAPPLHTDGGAEACL